MNIKISVGEALDRLSILQIKLVEVKNEEKLINIEKEYNYLRELIDAELGFENVDASYRDLFHVNYKLWKVEDELRICESKEEFDANFIKLARSVYYINDERAEIKKNINIQQKSEFMEEKSYVSYKKS